MQVAIHSSSAGKQPAQLNVRLPWVDYARGMAILLIVYRHSLIGLKRFGVNVPDFIYNIQEFVLNFRMPVFFMLSGYFLGKTLEKRSVKQQLNKKIKTLLYPYLLWAVILISLQILFSRFTNSDRTAFDYLYIFLQPRELDHMWYLLALFNTSCLFVIVCYFFKKNPLLHLLLAVVLHFFSFLLKDYSLFSDPFYHYIFLFCGAYIVKRPAWLEDKPNSYFAKTLFLIAPFFIAGQYFWLSYRPETVVLIFPFLIIIFIACGFFYYTCRFLQKSGIALWLSKVGVNSLYIYILHVLIISSFRVFSLKVLKTDNIFFLIVGSLVLGILIPILIKKVTSTLGMWYLFSLEKPKKEKNNLS